MLTGCRLKACHPQPRPQPPIALRCDLADTTAGTLAVEQHIVGAYELGPLLATGTVGEVYRAHHRETGTPAVVKFLQAATAREPELQRRFVREVAIAEKLNHPNIVRHFDCGLHDDRIYFAMELVECGTLKDVLQQRGRLPWREAAECAVQICDCARPRAQQGSDPSRFEARQPVSVR